jgi:ribosomal protein S18
MNITKLTITPVIKGAHRIVIENPTTERAQRLVLERLSSNYEQIKPAKFKLPKFLKGFVNPRTRVTDRTKFM